MRIRTTRSRDMPGCRPRWRHDLLRTTTTRTTTTTHIAIRTSTIIRNAQLSASVIPHNKTRSRFSESSQQRYANVATVTWLARHFETVKFPMTSSPRARPSNWANAELYRYKIVAVSLHKTHICVVKSLVKIAAVSWHSLRRFIKPAPGAGFMNRRSSGTPT